VRARTDVTKGPGSREAGLAMVLKLVQAAQERWRRIDGYELVALVRAGDEVDSLSVTPIRVDALCLYEDVLRDQLRFN